MPAAMPNSQAKVQVLLFNLEGAVYTSRGGITLAALGALCAAAALAQFAAGLRPINGRLLSPTQ